jgi:ADP-heptose:LPS heptosyltransferase
MLNKQWNEEYLQNVINKLSSSFRIVQLGLESEPKLNNTLDLRGSSISQSANYLANATFFLGQVGFLMHLSRAVNTRSVIIYGGREKSWQSGYPCNENVETNLECSPCWQKNHCDYDRTCLKGISVNDVLEAIERVEKRLPKKLETEVVVLS